MDNWESRRAEELASHSGPQALPTKDLLQQIGSDAKSLIQMELELAREEAKLDIDAEIDLAKGAVIASVCAILGLNMLIVAAVFALAPHLAWVVAMCVGFSLLAVAAAAAWIGWKRAEKNPMSITRESLMEDVEWARQQVK